MASHTRPGRGVTVARGVLLNVGAVFGTLCIIATVAAVFFGVKPVVFRSGSMGPAIETGALGLVHNVPAADLHTGDVVSVVDSAGTRITHRIVAIDRRGAEASLTLKGDANNVADAQPYVVKTADRLFFHVNELGYAIAVLSHPIAIFVEGAIFGGLLVFVFRSPRRDPAEPEPDAESDDRAERTSRHSTAKSIAKSAATTATVLVVVAAVVIGPVNVANTQAAFADAASAPSGSVSTLTVTATPETCTTQGVLTPSAQIGWTYAASASRYELSVSNSASLTNPELYASVDNPTPAGTKHTVTLTPNLLATLLNLNLSGLVNGYDIWVILTTYSTAAPTWFASVSVKAHINALGLSTQCA